MVVGCDGTFEGRNAVVLAAAIAAATGAHLSFVGVFPPALVSVPASLGRAALRAQMELALRRERDSFAPMRLWSPWSTCRCRERCAASLSAGTPIS
jgi:hypothetical protein